MFLRALFQSIARRPKRFAVAVLAVAMGVGMAVALASVSLVLGDRLSRTVRQYGANIVVLPKGADVPLEVAGADLSRMVDAGSLPLSTVDGLHSFRWRNNILGVAPQAYAAGAIGAVRVPVVGTWFAHGGDGMKAIAPWWKV